MQYRPQNYEYPIQSVHKKACEVNMSEVGHIKTKSNGC